MNSQTYKMPPYDPTALHISQVNPKTALRLANENLKRDGYHNAIKADAQTLLKVKLGNYIYVAQDSATVWRNPDYTRTVSVKNGTIRPSS